MTSTDTMGRGLIAGIGRLCFRRRWWICAAWLVIAVAGFLSAGRVFAGLSNEPGGASLESVRGANVLTNESQVGDSVVGEVVSVDPRAGAVRAAVVAAATDIAQIPGVRGVATPYDPGLSDARATALISHDGTGLLLDVTLRRLADDPERAAVSAVTDRLDALQTALRRDAAQPQARVLVGGGAVLGQQVNAQVQSDLSRAEELSLPITLVVLMFVFGGVIAAGLPVVAAILSVFAAMAALLGFEQLTDLDENATIVVTLLGLGLSIDYGLLLVARYREELGRGHAPEVAIGRAWSSAGRTVLFSALTVAGSLCGLALFGVTSMTALAVAGVSIAIVAMTVALTATAALLGLAHKRIRPSRRAARRIARFGDAGEAGFFAWLSRAVQRRPLVTALVTAAALLAAGLPLFTTTPRLDSLASLPRSLSAVRVADDLSDRFGRPESPAVTVVARTDPASLTAWAARWRQDGEVTAVGPAVPVGPNLSTVDLYVSGDQESSAARALVHRVRADRPTGVRSWVTGDAAVLDDVLALIGHRLPWAIGLTVLVMLVLLFLMTGSLVVPAKAIAMNAVSLGAAVGVMSLVFQHGVGASVLHTLTVGSLDPFVIVGVLAFAFGLSMDYEVFLLARIKEYVDAGWPTDAAVRRGPQRSGRVITSAALLMVIVFGCFLVGRVGNTQQIGLGLAAAIAIDATIVRCLLVPATMTLLGRWNWWAPTGLVRWRARWAGGTASPSPARQPATVSQSGG
ncbi:MAG TPA: MMPL family transporter [Micromonosporaceae bacterium]|jgi:RND superfamily putative drug exporter